MQIKALLLLTRDRGDESAGHCKNHEHRRVQEETGQREAGTHQALQRVHLADRHHPAYEDLPATPTRNEREGGGVSSVTVIVTKWVWFVAMVLAGVVGVVMVIRMMMEK